MPALNCQSQLRLPQPSCVSGLTVVVVPWRPQFTFDHPWHSPFGAGFTKSHCGTKSPGMPPGTATRSSQARVVVCTSETAGFATAIATAADRFKSDLDKASTLAKPDRDAVKKDADILIKQANAVKSRTSDGKLATAELRQLVEQVAKLQTFVGAHPIPTMTNWEAVQTSLGKLQQAFGLTP